MSDIDSAASTRCTDIRYYTYEPYPPSTTLILPNHNALVSNEEVFSPLVSGLHLGSNMIYYTEDQQSQPVLSSLTKDENVYRQTEAQTIIWSDDSFIIHDSSPTQTLHTPKQSPFMLSCPIPEVILST